MRNRQITEAATPEVGLPTQATTSPIEPRSAKGLGGLSGKRRGRPKKHVNVLKMLRQKLDVKLEANVGGSVQKISKGEFGVIKLVNRFAETGDFKLFMKLFEILDQNTGPEIIELDHSNDVRLWTEDELMEALNTFWDRYITSYEVD